MNSQGRNSPDAFCCHWWKTQDGYDVILVVTKRMSLTHRAQIFMRCCAEQLVAVQTWCKGIFKTISLPKNDLWRSRLQRADVQRQCCEPIPCMCTFAGWKTDYKSFWIFFWKMFGLVFVVVDNAVGQACDWLGFRCGWWRLRLGLWLAWFSLWLMTP